MAEDNAPLKKPDLPNRGVPQKPLVSIVMCVFNGMRYIEDAVASILAQTYDNWELIISDDASTDGTTAWLKETLGQNQKIKLFFQPQNLGYVRNKNFAHKLASGVYITQLDSDDLSAPNRLELLTEVVFAKPEIKMVASGYKRIDEYGKVINKVSAAEDTLLTSLPSGECPFWFPGLLIHREVFERIGYFNDYFSGVYGDDLYWTALAIQHYPIYCITHTLYMYRNNPVSLTNSYNVRKLIIPTVLLHLLEQRRTHGSDWLEERNIEALKHFEAELKGNRIFMSEQLRVWAAKAIDQKNKVYALELLWKAFKLNPINKALYRTGLYFLKPGRATQGRN